MPDYGLTPEGFTIKPLEAIIEDAADDFGSRSTATLGALAKRDDTLEGHLFGAICAEISTCWELIELLYSSMNPNSAADTVLEGLAAISGSIRNVATKSEATLTLTGTPATAVLAGRRSSGASGDEWETVADATIAALTAWVTSTAYAIGDRVTRVGEAYVCTVAGTSGSGPSGTTQGATEADGSVTWRHMGSGTGAVDAEAENTVTGPVGAVALSILTIETPVSGWDSVINLTDAVPGTDIETDEDFRVRRVDELAKPGTGTPEAIRADILSVAGVITCTVFNNPTDVTDPDGVPPHSVEVLVKGGDNQAIWDQLWLSVPAGIGSYGTEVGTAVDSEGVSQPVAFSRAAPIEIYVDVELTYDASTYGTDDVVKEAIVAAGLLRGAGLDAVASRVSGDCFGAPGVLDVTLVEIGTAPSPSSSATISIGTRELAVYDTTRITVVSTPGTP